MIELKNVSKKYHNKKNDFLALKNINLKFDNTGIVFIFGESGNGKSTLLNLMSGLDKYEEGQILVNGVDLNSLSYKELEAYRRNYIGYVFEDYNLIEDLTIKENLKISSNLRGIELTDEEITKLLLSLDLENLENRLPNQLSSGQKQRVSIARVMFDQPKILFVDEPTGHLDYNHTNKIWNLIKEISKNCLVVAVSHEKRIVDEFADRVVELRNGEVYSDEVKNVLASNVKKVNNDIKNKKAIENGENNNPLKIEFKGKIKPSYIAKISMGNLIYKKFRTFMFIVLSCVSLLLFSIFFLLNSYNQNYVLARTANEKSLDYITFSSESQINNGNLNNIKEKINSTTFYNLKNRKMILSFGNTFKYSDDKDYILNGIIEIDVNSETNNLQKLTIGNYPTNNNLNDIVVSDYTAMLIMKYGINIKENGVYSLYKPDKFEEILNKNLAINNRFLKICGVYETNYSKYYNSDLTVKKDIILEDALYNVSNVYNKIYASTEYIKQINSDINFVTNVNVNAKSSFTKDDELINKKLQDLFKVSYDMENATIAGSKVIGSKQINLPYKVFNYLFNQKVTANLSNFVIGNYDINISLNNDINIDYKVVGVNTSDDSIFVNEMDFKNGVNVNGLDSLSLIDSTMYPCFNLVVSTTNANSLSSLIGKMQALGYSYQIANTTNILEFSNKIEVFKNTFLIVSIITAIFSAVFMFMFIEQLIEDRRRDIGILIALGADKLDIVHIFMFTAFIITIMCFILSSLFTVILSFIINSLYLTSLTFNVFSLNVMTFVWLFIISAVVSIVSSLVPIIKSSKLSPVEVLKKK